MSDLVITKNYLLQNPCYRTGKKRTPIGIQIHSIGTAQGTASAVASYWNQPSVQACVTYVCDSDTAGKVLQLLPEETRSWADAGYGNNNLITIEMCESDYMRYSAGANFTITDPAKFKADVTRSYQTAVLLCADICKRYGWDPLGTLASGLHLISSHDEGRKAGLSSAHVDPTHIWDEYGWTMAQFRKDVLAAMSSTDAVYRVGKYWKDGKCAGQIGAFSTLDNAVKACESGYSVFDTDGKAVHQSTYAEGQKYKLTVNCYVRTAVSGGYTKYEDLTAWGKTKVIKDGKKVKFKAGTSIEALEVTLKDDGDVWVRVRSGWLCLRHEGTERAKKL